MTTTHKSGNGPQEARGRLIAVSSLALEGCVPTGTVRQQPVLPRTALLPKTYWRGLPRETASTRTPVLVPGRHTGLPRRMQDTCTAYFIARSTGQTYNPLKPRAFLTLKQSQSMAGMAWAGDRHMSRFLTFLWQAYVPVFHVLCTATFS